LRTAQLAYDPPDVAKTHGAKEDRYFLESLGRGLALLDYFAGHEAGGGMSLKEAADGAGFELTATLRITHTLEQLGYLTRDADTKRYTLGPKTRRLGLVALQRHDVREVALPHIRALVKDVRETVSLATLVGSQAVVIERIESQHALTVRGRVGWPFPVHSTSLGKALLAWLPAEESAEILRAAPREKTTPRTKTHLRDLQRELAEVRRLGYSINDEESADDIRAVAAPIRDGFGDVVAAINVGGPTIRLPSPAALEGLADKVLAAAGAISADLGHTPAQPGDPGEGRSSLG
jgi:IclR family pca regulon transcriptional regulator